jgi:acyl-CoA synthetase (AMP-forming)/AMP-acid ligase II
MGIGSRFLMHAPEMVGVTTGREAWRHRVELSSTRAFLHFEGQTWTYGELDEQASRYAGALAQLGVGQGTRVMVGLSNRPETMILLVAVLQLGAAAVPLQGGLTFNELGFQIEHCESTILIADDTVAATVLPRIGELSAVTQVIADDETAATTPLSSLADGPPLAWSDLPGHTDLSPALILYTSGSTGRPKGVVLPAGAFPSAGEAFNDRFGFGADDNYFLPLTMSHALGAVTAPAMAIMAGGSITLADRFSPLQFWSQVAQTGATATILFPTHINLLMETQEGAPPAGGSSLRLVITHTWIERFRARFGAELALVWGMTETGAMCTGSEPGQRNDREGFVGAPMVGVQVQVRDELGRALGPGQSGEICLHHPHAMLGYLKDPEATSRAIVDGWVQSGDIGTLDDHGYLYFQGRTKNMIKRSGENISAEEVENVFSSLPGVSECLVFGVPDPIRSEEVALVVVVRDGIEAKTLLEQGREKLGRWKLPRYVATTGQPLPRLGNGKLDRRAVRRDFDANAAYDRERA